MIHALNHLNLFGEWTLRLERLNSPGETLAVVVLFIVFTVAVVCLYTAVKREVSKRQRRFLLVCRLLAVLVLFLYCMQPSIVHWQNQSRVVILCDTSRSMSIIDDSMHDDHIDTSPTTPEKRQTRLRRVRDYMQRSASHNRDSTRPWIVHELQCDTVGQSLLSGCSIRSGEDWRARLTEWLDRLQPNGKESRLAEQLAEVVVREKNRSLAGIVLLSDGCNNIGMSGDVLLERLKTSPCPVHVVAVGKKSPAFEYGVTTLRAPARSRLQTDIPVSIELASRGTPDHNEQGRMYDVDLFMIAKDSSGDGSDAVIPTIAPGTKPVASVQFYMTDKGELYANPSDVPAALSVSSANTAGEVLRGQSPLKIQTRIKAVACGRFALVARIRQAHEAVMSQGKPFTVIEVFDRKDRILIVSGGPLRDFQFFESRLKRSSDIWADVYLTFSKRFYHVEPVSGQERKDDHPAHDSSGTNRNNISQVRFTTQFLSEYDAMIAFDPDWKDSFTSNEYEALEAWVARHGGGLIASVAPVFAGQQIDGWTQSVKTKIIRALYPVRFFAADSRIDSDFSTIQPRRVRLVGKDGLDFGPFASLGQDVSFDWSAFSGFYGALPVEAVKPAATLWATLDHQAQSGPGNQKLAVVFASQRYGAGRVFYIGTSELWRLRMLDESLPDRMLMSLIQYVSEGRREKMSPFGRLSIDREVCLPGTTVMVQAVLNDVNAKPLVLDNATVETVSPQGDKAEMKLVPRADMTGVYDGSLVVTERGRWNLACPVPGTNEVLRTSLLVKENDLESPPAYRDDRLLRSIAEVTGGRYMDADANELTAKGSDADSNKSVGDLGSLLESLPALQRIAVEDHAAQQILRAILLSCLCSCFLIEWLSRRIMGLV